MPDDQDVDTLLKDIPQKTSSTASASSPPSTGGDDVDSLLSSIPNKKSESTAPTGPAQPKSGIQKFLSPDIKITPEQRTEFTKGVAGDINKMRRGIRGVAVGAENLILRPTKPGTAVIRANEALQPGYRPKKGEKLATFTSGVVDPVNLMASAMIPGSGLLTSGASGAAAVGLDKALEQLEESGKVKPGDVSMSSALGGVIGMGMHILTHGAVSTIENSPAILKALANVPKRATKTLMENPDLQKVFKGTPEEIQGLVRGVQDSMNQVKDSSQNYFGKALGKLGLTKTSEEKILSKPLRPQDIPTNFQSVLKLGDKLKPVDRLKSLLQQRQSIDHYVDFRTGTVKPVMTGSGTLTAEQATGLLDFRKQINNAIEKTPGGEILRDADHVLHGAATIFSDLQQHLATPGRAEQFLRDTFENDDAVAQENLVKLMALEKETGRPVIQNLFKSLSSAEFTKRLGANKLRSTIGGVTTFIVSRALGIPYAAGLGLAAASQSPSLLRRVVTTGKYIEPALEKAEVPGFLAGTAIAEKQFLAPALTGVKAVEPVLHGGVHPLLTGRKKEEE